MVTRACDHRVSNIFPTVTSEPRLSALAIAASRNKGKGWIIPTPAMEQSNQDLMAPAAVTAIERAKTRMD